jgi:hypothetical protein
LAVALVLMTAGCGRAADRPSQAGPPPADATTTSSGDGTAGGGAGDPAQPQCPTVADITSTLGVTVVLAEDPDRNGDSMVECVYLAKKADGSSGSVAVGVQTGQSHDDYLKVKRHITDDLKLVTSDRSGIGDEAFTYLIGPAASPDNALWTRKGKVIVYIQCPVSLEQQVALANLLFTR